MNKLTNLYISRVLRYAELPEERSQEVRDELGDHLNQLVAERREEGLSEEEASLTAIKSMGHPKRVGQRFSRPFQWVDIRTHGTARGVVAIGPRAVGIFAFGGVAIGLIATGGFALGLVAAGGMAIGLVAAGGWSAGLMSVGSHLGHVYFPRGSEPSWLLQLNPLMAVPTFIMRYIAYILPPYLVIIALGQVIMISRAMKQREEEQEEWLFD